MTLLAKMAIVLKEVVTASRYGRQDELDAFLIAFLLPAFVGSLMSNALNSSFVPVYIQQKEEGPRRELLVGVSFLNLVAVAFIALLTFLAGRGLLPRIASGFNGGKMEMTIRLLGILMPYIALSGISSLWSAALNAQERFAVVLLTPVISPLLIAIFLLLFPSGGIMVLAYGVLLGALIEAIVLGVVLRAGGMPLLPRWKGWTAPVREVLQQFLPAAAGGFLMGSTLIVDQSMAAMLPGGSVAALSYGNKAIGFLLALLTTALVTFLTPYFSKRSPGGTVGEDRLSGNGGNGRKGDSGLSVTLGRLLGIAFPLGLLCSLAIVVFSEPLVRLVFYRGVFTMTDIRLVAEVQTQLAWQIPFYLCAVILTRYIAAMRWNRIIFIVAGFNVAANILLNEFLMWRMGVKGIALSTSLVHVLSMVLLLLMVSGRNRIFFLRKITKRLYRYRGLSRVADLVRKAYIHDRRRLQIDDLDGDLSFDCALDEHISSQLFWRGEYSVGQLALLRRVLRSGMIFLDAGANKGEFSVVAAKYLKEGKVLAFEPVQTTADGLEANIAANGFRNVEVIRKGLGRIGGERVLYHAEDRGRDELNLGTFTLYPRPGLSTPAGKIDIVSLDDLMRERGDAMGGIAETRIDVMKIDIEGGELEMLQGAAETIRRWKPVIFIEINAITSRAAGYDPRELLLWLQGMGYRFERIGRKGRTVAVGIEGLREFQNLICYPTEAKKIAFFIPDMRGGGAEKAVCNLLAEMVKQGMWPELVLTRAVGVYLKDIPSGVRVIDLGKKRTVHALPGLIHYLKENKPSVLIANLSHANVVALLAARLTGSRTRVVVTEHAILQERPFFSAKEWFLEWAMKKMYPGAAARVAVSKAAARDLSCRLGIAEPAIHTIYNAVVNEALKEKAGMACDHPWLEKKEMPVFLAVGRLEPEKDFALLLKAFCRVRERRAARLIILGEGGSRAALEAQVGRLGLVEDVSMPGFKENPYSYMKSCDALVLSSRREGLSQALIEAMACGCPVISTDCGGPREILADGRFGLLVPVGDAEALAGAMVKTLDAGGGERNNQEGIQRAAGFSAERAGDSWSSLLQETGRKRMLYMITGLHTGGAERMLAQLLSALDRGWAPVVISLSDGSGPEDLITALGIPVHSLGMRAGRLPGPVAAMKLIRLVRQIRPDLIQGWMYHGNLAAQFAHFFLRRRVGVIWGIHHSIGSLEVEKGMTRRLIRIGARLSGLPQRIVYVSETSKEQHIALGYRAEKAVVIPNGVDPGVWRPDMGARAAVRGELELPSDVLLIGSLARYHPVKDHEHFLRAAALLVQRYGGGGLKGQRAGGAGNEPHFLLAGAGVDDRNETLQSMIGGLGLSGRVHLLGELRGPGRFLAALDIFTMHSLSEAMPMVLLEAMSCGLCCVSTDTGDAARVIGDTGRVVPVKDPEALAGAWEELIASGEEKRRSLGAAARARAAAQYGLSACVSAYDALYRELIGY